MHQQNYATREENNVVHDPQTEEKILIPPAPTATRLCNYGKGKVHYRSTCETKCKAETELRYRIVLATNMAKIYLDPEDSLKDDPYFYLAAYVDNVDRMRNAYITCHRICHM